MGFWGIRSMRVVTPTSTGPACIIIQDEKIASLREHSFADASMTIHDVGDSVVMPGLVDTHVHINEPGRTDWEGFETATRAAAAGGITTVVDMPLNCIPVTTSVHALEEKRRSLESKLTVDCGFYGGVVPGNSGNLLGLIREGVLGFKAFLTHSGIDDFPNVTEQDLRRALSILAPHQIPLLVHAELESCVVPWSGERKKYSGFLRTRPHEWEISATRLLIRLCEEFQTPIHIVHLSSSETLPLIEDAKRRGLPLTVETCPHYLCFQSEDIPDGNTLFKCTPPIREKQNKEALWSALRSGVIDFVVSDHSPCPPSMKSLETGDFEKAWGGISSLQFGLTTMWTNASKRGHSFSDLARWMCQRPAHFVGLGLRKGRLVSGADADLVVWDPEARLSFTPETIHHRHKPTPYAETPFLGRVLMTILRGSIVYETGSFLRPVSGQSLLSHAIQTQ